MQLVYDLEWFYMSLMRNLCVIAYWNQWIDYVTFVENLACGYSCAFVIENYGSTIIGINCIQLRFSALEFNFLGIITFDS